MTWPYVLETRSVSIQSSQFGASTLGQLVANEPTNLLSTYVYATTPFTWSCTMGHRPFRAVGWSRPVEYTVRRFDPNRGGNPPSISILSSTGALIGKIRTDIENSIVSGLEFTIVNGDCRDFVLTLNKLPEFPLVAYSVISVNVGDSDFNWYMGKVTDQGDLKAKDGNLFVFKGEGLSLTDIQNLVMDTGTIFTAPQDVGVIVEDILINQIVPFSMVKYNVSKINTDTGVLTANNIQPGSAKINEFLDSMARMSNHEWGVDGDGDFFFLPIESDVVRTFFLGYNVNDFNPRLNLQNVKNSIFMQRQQGLGSGGAGWVVSDILSDDTSIAKYGKRELRYQAPGFFSDSDLTLIGTRLLEDLKDPKVSATSNGFQVFTEAEFIRRGIHRFILPFDQYPETWNEAEDVTEWSAIGGGITLSDETSIIVLGASAIRGECTGALNSRIELTQPFKGNIAKIRFWFRASERLSEVTVGVGLTNWNEHTTTFGCPVQDQYFSVEWDLSALNLKRLGKFAVQIPTNDPVDVYIDQIDVVVNGFPYYKVKSTKQTYRFAPENSSVSMEFDRVPSKMEDYINNILAIAEQNKFTGEVR